MKYVHETENISSDKIKSSYFYLSNFEIALYIAVNMDLNGIKLIQAIDYMEIIHNR